jgi:hypothetical protein
MVSSQIPNAKIKKILSHRRGAKVAKVLQVKKTVLPFFHFITSSDVTKIL